MTQTETSPRTRPDAAAIAAQNDAFRKWACLGIAPDRPVRGRIHVTRSVIEAGDDFVTAAVLAAGAFDSFEIEDDSECWQDFGVLEIRGETVFWRLDLYEADSDFRHGAETPDNPETTRRVLTLMMARDW